MDPISRLRQKIHSEKYEWADREPNAVRLMMAVQRGAVLLGKDHVKILNQYQQPEDSNGRGA